MDDDLRRHLAEGAAPTSGRGGPAAGSDDTMAALSVLSTDLGRLQQQVEQLAAQVATLGSTVKELADQDQGTRPTPPPRPWDWEAMSDQDRNTALLTLATWLQEELHVWWPRASAGIPACWMEHPDMVRDLSLLYVAHQQAYKHPERRPHHEVDWRRALADMLHSISEAKMAYHCESTQHTVQRPTDRADLAQVQHTVRERALTAIGAAEREGDQETAARLIDQHKVSAEELRTHMGQEYRTLMERVGDPATAPEDRAAAADQAARLLVSYDLVATDDLAQGLALGALLLALHQAGHPLLSQVSRTWGPVARKAIMIRDDLLPQIYQGRTEAEQRLLARYDTTLQEVELVRSLAQN